MSNEKFLREVIVDIVKKKGKRDINKMNQIIKDDNLFTFTTSRLKGTPKCTIASRCYMMYKKGILTREKNNGGFEYSLKKDNEKIADEPIMLFTSGVEYINLKSWLISKNLRSGF